LALSPVGVGPIASGGRVTFSKWKCGNDRRNTIGAGSSLLELVGPTTVVSIDPYLHMHRFRLNCGTGIGIPQRNRAACQMPKHPIPPTPTPPSSKNPAPPIPRAPPSLLLSRKTQLPHQPPPNLRLPLKSLRQPNSVSMNCWPSSPASCLRSWALGSSIPFVPSFPAPPRVWYLIITLLSFSSPLSCARFLIL